jgi:hypothetical protein
MTKQDVLLLKFVLRAERSLGTTMPANRTHSYGASGWPLAHLGAVEQRRRRPIGALTSN